jgi:hypothetical protein
MGGNGYLGRGDHSAEESSGSRGDFPLGRQRGEDPQSSAAPWGLKQRFEISAINNTDAAYVIDYG